MSSVPASNAPFDFDPAERRSAKRHRTIQKGLITFKDSHCDQPCAILDMSETGAKLRPLDAVIVPERFQLRDHKSKIHECAVKWRQGSTMGVKFL